MPELTRIGILDDYQGVALTHGPWDRLPAGLPVDVFRDTITGIDALAARLAPYDALVIMRERTPFPRALIERLPKLRLLVTTGARNRAVDVAACAERGITVCGTPSVAHPTVDLTWGLILSLARGIPTQERALREGRWQGLPLGLTLEGRTLGVIGLGTLGSRVARVGDAFGMRVIAWSQNLTADRAAAAGATLVDKPTLLREADIVTLHLVLSDRSRGTIGAAELALMKPGALLVNTSRGPLVQQDALVAALREHRIGGAGLDVFDEEPLPSDHPLLGVPNTVLTPHLGYVTVENYRLYYESAVEAIEAWCAGAPVREIRPG
jgi:phosphoglycerate dehydrogenase-like enzyme